MSRVIAWLKRRCGLVPPEERLAKIRAAGLISETRFCATRALEVAEYADEGRHFFLDLQGSSVLYLEGQYLYDYGIDPSGSDNADQSTFPATEFTLLRHRVEKHVLQIVPNGRKLPPQFLCPPYTPEDYAMGLVPNDCDIITAFSFDQLLDNQGRLRTPNDRGAV